MHILIVEDEPKLGAYLRKGLLESGFITDLAITGEEGLHMALESSYELILLDVMLPKADGWTVLRKLREQSEVPVLMLTARDEVSDRVKGLELGADDYLVKPFAFVELVARIKTLLRRGPVRTAEVIRVADLEMNVLRR
ncbi:response regulator, partial [Pseudoduganella sp. RAF53_2]